MGYPGQDHYRGTADALGIGDHVTFTGRLPYGEAPLHLALGDLAVAPKMSETEGNGKLLNYMSVGLPTVAFDAPVNREFLGEAGDYAGFGDIDDLARQMLRLLAAPEAAAARGRLLRERAVEQFSWTSGVQALLDVYAELVGSGARRGFAEGARSARATIRGA
jgi:glycosyltransferase involved in cell wall biosynthesis